MTVEDVLALVENDMEFKTRLAEVVGSDSQYDKLDFAWRLLRNFSHYQNAGGTKTLAEILKGDS